jgi:hypothetical protein
VGNLEGKLLRLEAYFDHQIIISSLDVEVLCDQPFHYFRISGGYLVSFVFAVLFELQQRFLLILVIVISVKDESLFEFLEFSLHLLRIMV